MRAASAPAAGTERAPLETAHGSHCHLRTACGGRGMWRTERFTGRLEYCCKPRIATLETVQKKRRSTFGREAPYLIMVSSSCCRISKNGQNQLSRRKRARGSTLTASTKQHFEAKTRNVDKKCTLE